jgi:hypothetical protein
MTDTFVPSASLGICGTCSCPDAGVRHAAIPVVRVGVQRKHASGAEVLEDVPAQREMAAQDLA